MFFTQALLLTISIIACDAEYDSGKKHVLHGGFVPNIPIDHGRVILHDHGYERGYGHGYGHGYGYGDGVLHGVGIGPGIGLVAGSHGLYGPSYGHVPVHHIHKTIVNRVVPYPVPVPQPYPVTRKIPVPVPHPVPVEVKRPVPVPVPHPVPFVVTKAYPVNVPRPVPVPVPQPVHVPHPVPQPVPVPHPVSVPFHQHLQISPNPYPLPLPPQNVQPIAPIAIGHVNGDAGAILEGGHSSGLAISSGIVNGGEHSAGFVGVPNSELHLSEQSGEGYSYPVPSKKFF